VLRLRRYERISVQDRRFCSNGGQLTKISGRRGRPIPNHSFSQKTRLNNLWYGIKIWTALSFLLSQFTRLTDRHDGRTESFLIALPRLHSMQRSKNKAGISIQGCLFIQVSSKGKAIGEKWPSAIDRYDRRHACSHSSTVGL